MFGPLSLLWDEQSTWYVSFDRSAMGRETVTFSGMCGNFDGDPYSAYNAAFHDTDADILATFLAKMSSVVGEDVGVGVVECGLFGF